VAEVTETTTSTARSTRTRSRKRKNKPNQIPFGILAGLIIVLVGIWLGNKNATLALYWILGLSFGFILQRARFCFTASMRDPYLTKSTSVTRAVLIAFALTSIGFTAIKYGYHVNGLPIPGQGYIAPISIATGVGAFIFGIGMVIAGGCASGTLMRIGEGFWMQVLSLVFFVIGSLWGAHDYGWWSENFIIAGKKVFLPDVFGWFGGLMANLLIIAVIYVIAHKYGTKSSSEH
jgi:uncharacterized membrane protein YedE/YeeE